jgi:phage terminase Nu1 subunit (DNA packaging protein)
MATEEAGTVTVDQLAQLFDCDQRTIQNLAKAGIIAKAARGRYFFAPSIRGYVVHLRARAAGRHGSDSEIDAVTEGALLKRSQRINYELKNAALEAQTVPLEDIRPA